MAKALLINPSYKDSYGSAKASVVDPIYPTPSILALAAMAQSNGHKIEILDLSYSQYDYRVVRDKIEEFKPDVVGVTATTPLMNQMRDISVLVKSISKDILVIGGGSHVSCLPGESMEESMLDMVAVGEGDHTFLDILNGLSPQNIKGIHYRKGSDILGTDPRPFVQNLDDLPMPAWHLYDSRKYKYKISRLLAKRRPLAMAEFSRGCLYKCNFCASKNTVGLGLRKKSPARCVAEAREMRRLGYREFTLADDIFTSDQAWAKAVSEEMIRADLDMTWTCTNGIRVESAEPKMFEAMRKAGCYRVAFGFETGSDDVLKGFGKGGKASIEQGREAVKMAKAAGIETIGFFLLGLSHDNEETVMDTINYARSLPLDMLKFGIAIAFPGTPMFVEYRKKGLIRSYNWDDYFIYTTQPLFAHPKLSIERINEYMGIAYRKAILANPSFITRRLWRGIKTGEFFWDVYYFLKFATAPAINKQTHSAIYFAKDKWPKYDFTTKPITYYPIRHASNTSTKEASAGIEI
ncbi:B12-binding domain-containing radical SAM protein [Elusimicrobiota bacterium]